MSAKVTIWAWKQADRLEAKEGPLLLTLLAVADMARDTGKVWASHAYLAKKAHQSPRTIRANIDALEDRGFLRTEPTPGRPDVIWLNLTAMTLFEHGPETDEPGALEKGPRRPRQEMPMSGSAGDAGGVGTERGGTSARGADKPRIEPKEEPESPLRAGDPFEDWWKVYPRRQGKGDAREKFWKAAAKVAMDTLMERTREFADHVKDEDPKFIAHPATWLHQERWNDDLPKKVTSNGSTGTGRASRWQLDHERKVANFVKGAMDFIDGGG